MNDLRPWMCKPGSPDAHILGQCGRNGNGIRQVIIYREAMDQARLKDAPDVLLVAEGLVMDVRCSICGELRNWEPGQESIQKIIDMYLGGFDVSENKAI